MDITGNFWVLFLAGVISLCVGSFLNVIIYRLPLLIENQNPISPSRFNCWIPGSFCTRCKRRLPLWTILPIFSYLLLRGRSHCCESKIPRRYIVVEILSSIFSLLLILHFGFTLQLSFALIMLWCLVILSFIDFDSLLLPDQITLPLLWLGLFSNISATFCPLRSAVLGAISGYLFFFLLAKLVKKIKQVDGLGRGDAKCLAMLGAWFGFELLPAITFIASFSGAIYGIYYLLLTKQKSSTYLPFGPFLAFAAIICLFWGPKIVAFQLQSLAFLRSYFNL